MNFKMAKVTIISGFLGAGKTTFIKKLLEQVYAGQKVVLIENEFGEIGIDGGFLKDAGIQITEMNSGCICCSLVGDFGKALIKVSKEYAPDRIIIEPSGVGKLSDVAKAVEHVEGAHIGAKVTVSNDSRVTKVGAKLRKYRLDEVPQLFNVLKGEMSLVGTRPESVHYVQRYTPEMMATLLLPAGVTSETSIRYKDEAELLDRADDVDRVYVEQILPEKMKYNLESLRQFSLGRDLKTLFRTVAAVVQ